MKKDKSVNYILKDLLSSYFMWFTILSFAFAACSENTKIDSDSDNIKYKCKLIKIKL